MDILREVQRTIETYHLLQPGARVVVGVSGGPDSVTLLHVLRRLSGPLNLGLHVAHLHHAIRGADADADAGFVAALAAAWGLPCTVERVDVQAIAEREKLALEEAARHARYAFLCRVAQSIGATRIAVGHNADDQAETVLMHLLRGAGPAGLRGMLPETRLCDYHLLASSLNPPPEMKLIRPLLYVPRADIEAYCAEQQLETRFDRSNLDTTFFRNRLRHEVLPYLAQISPRIAQRLCHLAEVVRADYDMLHEFVSVAWDTLLVKESATMLSFNLAGWRGQPLAIQRAIIRCAAYQLCRSLRDVSFVHIEDAVRVAQHGVTGAQATLPHGLRLTVGYTTLTIAAGEALDLPPEKPWLELDARLPCPVPGEISLPGGWRLHIQEVPHWNLEVLANNCNPLVAWMDADVLGDAPILRTRRRGDTFQPQGLGGATVRLSALLTNVKMPRPWRDYVPLLEAGGRILWVVGVRLSEAAAVRPDTRRVVYLRFTRA
ncbi:MAG TPA: tRNA lysidine(34) synthetase TilS [Anaerolineae bacterium]|nr:tRNA lysidine(34) synthetase TilS [Anaerolineae bacterium]HQK12421.1 tRNA lysidine(34) synthetase TilS [Anaerolineae bacterium]